MSTYRDEKESLRARVEAAEDRNRTLEDENAGLRARIAHGNPARADDTELSPRPPTTTLYSKADHDLAVSEAIRQHHAVLVRYFGEPAWTTAAFWLFIVMLLVAALLLAFLQSLSVNLALGFAIGIAGSFGGIKLLASRRGWAAIHRERDWLMRLDFPVLGYFEAIAYSAGLSSHTEWTVAIEYARMASTDEKDIKDQLALVRDCHVRRVWCSENTVSVRLGESDVGSNLRVLRELIDNVVLPRCKQHPVVRVSIRF